MNILAIDSSSKNLSFACFGNGKILFNFNRCYSFGASKLVYFLDKNLKKSHIELKDIDVLALGYGPGSFTGLRISFSVVKAFALALKKPIITTESFYLMAYPFAKTHKKIAVISDAKRNLIYGCSFKVKNGEFCKEQKERLTTLEEFARDRKDYFFISYDMDLRKALLDINPKISFYEKAVYPKASHCLSKIERMYKKGKFVNIDKLEPLYLHPKTCQVRGK
jgi:tRNA threonylcarbamoyl adenosine modification protein YeaZ